MAFVATDPRTVQALTLLEYGGDFEKAGQLLAAAAADGCPEALVQIAQLLLAQGQAPLAYERLFPAAEKGHPTAQLRLAEVLRENPAQLLISAGVSPDPPADTLAASYGWYDTVVRRFLPEDGDVRGLSDDALETLTVALLGRGEVAVELSQRDGDEPKLETARISFTRLLGCFELVAALGDGELANLQGAARRGLAQIESLAATGGPAASTAAPTVASSGPAAEMTHTEAPPEVATQPPLAEAPKEAPAAAPASTPGAAEAQAAPAPRPDDAPEPSGPVPADAVPSDGQPLPTEEPETETAPLAAEVGTASTPEAPAQTVAPGEAACPATVPPENEGSPGGGEKPQAAEATPTPDPEAAQENQSHAAAPSPPPVPDSEQPAQIKIDPRTAQALEMLRSGKDFETAGQLLAAASRDGCPEALFQIGVILQTQEQEAAALQYFHHAAELGHVESQYQFARTVSKVPPNSPLAKQLLPANQTPIEAALSWYQRVADRKDSGAEGPVLLSTLRCGELAFELSLDTNRPDQWRETDRELAVRYLERFVDMHSQLPPEISATTDATTVTAAKFTLGVLCEHEKQNERAHHWFTLAFKAGHPLATVHLAKQHIHGEGCAQDLGKAEELLNEARRRGCAEPNLQSLRQTLKAVASMVAPKQAPPLVVTAPPPAPAPAPSVPQVALPTAVPTVLPVQQPVAVAEQPPVQQPIVASALPPAQPAPVVYEQTTALPLQAVTASQQPPAVASESACAGCSANEQTIRQLHAQLQQQGQLINQLLERVYALEQNQRAAVNAVAVPAVLPLPDASGVPVVVVPQIAAVAPPTLAFDRTRLPVGMFLTPDGHTVLKPKEARSGTLFSGIDLAVANQPATEWIIEIIPQQGSQSLVGSSITVGIATDQHPILSAIGASPDSWGITQNKEATCASWQFKHPKGKSGWNPNWLKPGAVVRLRFEHDGQVGVLSCVRLSPREVKSEVTPMFWNLPVTRPLRPAVWLEGSSAPISVRIAPA